MWRCRPPVPVETPAARGVGREAAEWRLQAPQALAPARSEGDDAVHTGTYVSGRVARNVSPGGQVALCFIQPQDAIRVIADSLGREARRQLVGEVVRAWVDDIPDQELSIHYAKAIADLDEEDLHLLAAWHASLEVGQPIPNTEFLVGVFPSLGENRREALKIAAGFRGEEAFQAGVAEEQALDTVLPRLSRERAIELGDGVHPAVHVGPPRLRQLRRRAAVSAPGIVLDLRRAPFGASRRMRRRRRHRAPSVTEA